MPLEFYPIVSYGEMYKFGQLHAISIGASNTWYTIGNMNAGELREFSFQNGQELVCNRPGKYMIDWSLCWTDGTLITYKFRIAINGTTIGKTQSCGQKGNANDVISSSSGGIIDLDEGDIITMEVLNATNTNSIEIIDANIRLQRIGNYLE